MKIGELKPGDKHLELKGKLSKLPEPKQVMTRFGSNTSVTNATLSDDTGDITLVLWGDQRNDLNEGDEIEITDGYVKDYRGDYQLGVSRKGTIKKV